MTYSSPVLLPVLEPEELLAIQSVLEVYSDPEPGIRLATAIRSVDALGTKVYDGEIQPRDKETVTSTLWKDWKKDIQSQITHLAAPRQGRERQAIALGHLRDFVLGLDEKNRWEDIQECRRQLTILYDALAPNPFN